MSLSVSAQLQTSIDQLKPYRHDILRVGYNPNFENWIHYRQNLPVYKHEDIYKLLPVTIPPRPEGSQELTWHGSEWSMVALGFAGGTLVLGLVLLFIRVINKCLNKRFLQEQRPDDRELRSEAELADLIVRTVSAADVPPSYSDCMRGAMDERNGLKSPVNCKNDLPSYSDCYLPTHSPGKHSNLYVICNEEVGATSPKNTSNGAVNSKNDLDQCDTIKISEIVIIDGAAGSQRRLVKDDTETEKTEEIGDV